MDDLTLEALGLEQRGESTLPFEHVRFVAATLDVEAADSEEPLPLLWHWAFFNSPAATRSLGLDGHPARDDPRMADFPRRMWVGGEVRSLAPLMPDRPTTRTSRLLSAELKHGSSGDLLIVGIEHTIEQANTPAVVERQDVVYRTAGGITVPPGEAVEHAATAEWSETITPTAALLFRFSAITFNSHRIHYDRDYAVGVERYPGVVVHGPLTAMLLAGSASRNLGRPLHAFSYRASAPLFADQPIHITGSLLDDRQRDLGADVAAIRIDGAIAMTAEAR